MCFSINPSAPRWGNTRVYKVVYPIGKSGRCFAGVWQDSRYTLGRFKHRSKGHTRKYDACYGWEARAGIYVYGTLEAASFELGRWANPKSMHKEAKAVIVELEVSPKDFLHTDGRGTATYEKAKIVRIVTE